MKLIRSIINFFKKIFFKKPKKDSSNTEINLIIEEMIKVEDLKEQNNFLDKLMEMTKEEKVKWSYCGD